VAGALGMNKPLQSEMMMATDTISNTQGTIAWGLFAIQSHWLASVVESRYQASNVEIVAGDLFATSNPLISQREKNLL
jgi:hypothetical protein